MSVPEGLRVSVRKVEFYKRIHKNVNYTTIVESYLENLNKIDVMLRLGLRISTPRHAPEQYAFRHQPCTDVHHGPVVIVKIGNNLNCINIRMKKQIIMH